jgi:squalene cyclase
MNSHEKIIKIYEVLTRKQIRNKNNVLIKCLNDMIERHLKEPVYDDEYTLKVLKSWSEKVK